MVRFLLGVALTLSVSAQTVSMIELEGEARNYWPRWRGPSGQGLVESKGYLDTWSDTTNVLWKVEVPGRGHSSPVVWKDRLFLTTSYDGNKRVVLCYNRSNGKLLWETAAPQPESAEHLYFKNSYATATPITDGQRVYALFGNGGLIALDIDGKLLWHHSFGSTSNYHGPGGSPLLYKDRLVFYQDQRSDAFVAAIDAKTGKVIWKTPRTERVGWGTPVAIHVDDGANSHDEIVISGQFAVRGYDPASGKELWSVKGNTMEVTPTPAVGFGLVFCSSGRAGPTLAIKPGGSGDVTDSRVAWQSPRGSPFIPSPLLYGDLLYLVNDMTSIATCLRAKTGETVWQGRLGEAKRESFSASPIAVDGKVFITNDEGETFVLAAGTEFKLLRTNPFGEQTLATPALVDGKWYYRTAGHLLAIGK